ncbi:MAG: IMPACT family protein [Propionibacteriaceae bacterium]|jgi:uncharacterized YigZ family protein|nr:IMPACT family protein [Propionibacteriaceae bacterium]
MTTSYATIAGPGQARVEIKKSQFLGWVEPVESEAAASAVIARRRKAHFDARHHVTAMIIGDEAQIQRSNDDGEPAGSGGAPVLAVLRHAGLTDLVAVVTRYFGGTLLGVGGLIRAYGAAVTQALADTTVIRYQAGQRLTVSLPHARAGDFEHLLRQWLTGQPAQLEAVNYASEAEFTLQVADAALADWERFLRPWLTRGLTRGSAEPTRLAL